MSGWFILVGYGVLIATCGWWGVLAAVGHVLVLLLAARLK